MSVDHGVNGTSKYVKKKILSMRKVLNCCYPCGNLEWMNRELGWGDRMNIWDIGKFLDD